MTSFEQLSEKQQQKWIDIATNALNDTLICTRVWEAWGVGTMSKSDFIASTDDPDVVFERAAEIYNSVQAENARLREALEALVLHVDHVKLFKPGSVNNIILNNAKKALEQ